MTGGYAWRLARVGAFHACPDQGLTPGATCTKHDHLSPCEGRPQPSFGGLSCGCPTRGPVGARGDRVAGEIAAGPTAPVPTHAGDSRPVVDLQRWWFAPLRPLPASPLGAWLAWWLAPCGAGLSVERRKLTTGEGWPARKTLAGAPLRHPTDRPTPTLTSGNTLPCPARPGPPCGGCWGAIREQDRRTARRSSAPGLASRGALPWLA